MPPIHYFDKADINYISTLEGRTTGKIVQFKVLPRNRGLFIRIFISLDSLCDYDLSILMRLNSLDSLKEP